MTEKPIIVTESILKKLKRALISLDDKAVNEGIELIDDIIESQEECREEHLRQSIQRSIDKTVLAISPWGGVC